MERILFDFKERYKEGMDILENQILFTSGRAYMPINEPETEWLIGLLQTSAVEVFKQPYPCNVDYPEEIVKKALSACMVLPNRRANDPIQAALSLFSPYEPERLKNRHNALFFADMKAFVRFGDVRPFNLLTMLAESGIDKVFVFPSACESPTKDAYYCFDRRIPKERFDAVMKNFRDVQTEHMIQAVNQANKKLGSIIPDVPLDCVPDD